MQLQRIFRPIPMLLLMAWTLVPSLWLLLSTFKEQYEVFDVPTSIITRIFPSERMSVQSNHPVFWVISATA